MVFSVDYKPQPGGIAEHAYRIALHLHRLGAPVCVLAPEHPGCGEFDGEQPFPTYRVPAWPGFDTVVYLLYALGIIVKRNVEVVYCATAHPCGAICLVLRPLVRFRYTLTIHAHEVVYRGRGWRPALKRLLKPLQVRVIRAADRVFAVSSFTRDALIEAGIPEGKIAVLPNGVDPDEFEDCPKDRTIVDRLGLVGRPVILTVARLDTHKGQDTVIRALPAILSKAPQAVYVIVGDGPMRKTLEQLSRDCGVSERVFFTGYIPRAQVLALLEACAVFVMVSRIEGGSAEGFGIVFLEAGVFSKPVIGGRSGGIPDAVAHGRTGLLVDPLDVDEVAGAVCRILTDRDEATRFGRAGRERVISDFTWDRTLRTLLENLSE
jgi:phosphatidylinositol alpha-1,6-mannosyltransferase